VGPRHALRGGVQAGFRAAGPVHTPEGRHQCLRRSFLAASGVWKFGAKTFGMSVINDLPLMLGLVIELVKNATILNKLACVASSVADRGNVFYVSPRFEDINLK
jgi:hypothetical protein